MHIHYIKCTKEERDIFGNNPNHHLKTISKTEFLFAVTNSFVYKYFLKLPIFYSELGKFLSCHMQPNTGSATRISEISFRNEP